MFDAWTQTEYVDSEDDYWLSIHTGPNNTNSTTELNKKLQINETMSFIILGQVSHS